MSLVFYRPTGMYDVTNNLYFGQSGTPSATVISSANKVIGVHPPANTRYGDPLHSLFFIKNDDLSLTYTGIKVSLSRDTGTQRSVAYLGKTSTYAVNTAVTNTNDPKTEPANTTWSWTQTVPNLAPSAYYPLWIKRLPNAYTSNPSQTNVDPDIKLHVTALAESI